MVTEKYRDHGHSERETQSQSPERNVKFFQYLLRANGFFSLGSFIEKLSFEHKISNFPFIKTSFPSFPCYQLPTVVRAAGISVYKSMGNFVGRGPDNWAQSNGRLSFLILALGWRERTSHWSHYYFASWIYVTSLSLHHSALRAKIFPLEVREIAWR